MSKCGRLNQCAQANPGGPGQFQEPPLHWPSDRHDRLSHRCLRRAHDRDRLRFSGGRHHRGAHLHGDPGAPGADPGPRAACRRPAHPRRAGPGRQGQDSHLSGRRRARPSRAGGGHRPHHRRRVPGRRPQRGAPRHPPVRLHPERLPRLALGGHPQPRPTQPHRHRLRDGAPPRRGGPPRPRLGPVGRPPRTRRHHPLRPPAPQGDRRAPRTRVGGHWRGLRRRRPGPARPGPPPGPERPGRLQRRRALVRRRPRPRRRGRPQGPRHLLHLRLLRTHGRCSACHLRSLRQRVGHRRRQRRLPGPRLRRPLRDRPARPGPGVAYQSLAGRRPPHGAAEHQRARPARGPEHRRARRPAARRRRRRARRGPRRECNRCARPGLQHGAVGPGCRSRCRDDHRRLRRRC